MKIDGKRLLICDCEGTIPLDADALGKACGSDAPTVHTQLCRGQLGDFQRAVLEDGPLIVACTQEAPLFGEAGAAGPKIAALLAEAALDIQPTPSVTMESKGVVLVYGRDETAVEAARQLAKRADVTVLLRAPGEVQPPRVMNVPIFRGTITGAAGHLGPSR